jgi:LCP family protein required for cell wall assembly
VLAVVVAIVAVFSSSGYLYTLYRYHQIHKVEVAHLDPRLSGQPINILLIGDNCRECLNGRQASSYGNGAIVGGGRSDVTMILHLNPATKTASIVSLPRDSFVPVPGQSVLKRVDDSLDEGPSALVQTIEDDYGVPINNYVELNFDSFQNVVDALGGIDMYFPVRVRDYYSGLNVPVPGCYHLNGYQALAVVRARHLYYGPQLQYYDPTGDISRIHRDHEFLKVLGSELKKNGITNPLKLNSVLGSIFPQLVVDQTFSLSEMFDLALTFGSINPNTVPTTTLPVYEYNQSYIYDGFNDGDVVFPTEPFTEQTIAAGLGIVPPPVAPGTTLQVLDGSGIQGQAGQFAADAQSLGYKVVGTGTAPIAATPAETIVYYRPAQKGQPSEEGQAEALAGHLVGEVAMGVKPLPPGVDLELVTGTYVSYSSTPAVPAERSATTGARKTTTTRPSSPAKATSTTGTTSTGTTSTSTTVTGTTVTNPTASSVSANFPGDIVNVTPANEPLPAFDPRACPAGMVAKPLQYGRG